MSCNVYVYERATTSTRPTSLCPGQRTRLCCDRATAGDPYRPCPNGYCPDSAVGYVSYPCSPARTPVPVAGLIAAGPQDVSIARLLCCICLQLLVGAAARVLRTLVHEIRDTIRTLFGRCLRNHPTRERVPVKQPSPYITFPSTQLFLRLNINVGDCSSS